MKPKATAKDQPKPRDTARLRGMLLDVSKNASCLASLCFGTRGWVTRSDTNSACLCTTVEAQPEGVVGALVECVTLAV
jgi:hypothetical protein